MKFLIFAFLVFLHYGLQAQVKSSSWQGTIYVPTPMDCRLDFRTDTAVIRSLESGEMVEMMNYRTAGDTLYLRKLGGMSPCDFEKEAIYLYRIDGERLLLNVQQDECDARRYAFPKDGWERIRL